MSNRTATQRVLEVVETGSHPHHTAAGGSLCLRDYADKALRRYFTDLKGHDPAQLYDLVLGEIEQPLLKALMEYTRGNQSRAATILGLNRSTLRKKLRQYKLNG